MVGYQWDDDSIFFWNNPLILIVDPNFLQGRDLEVFPQNKQGEMMSNWQNLGSYTPENEQFAP